MRVLITTLSVEYTADLVTRLLLLRLFLNLTEKSVRLYGDYAVPARLFLEIL